MGVGDVIEPPKKKLKQAQLIFPSSLEKCGSKRKLTAGASPESGSALKVSRKDPPEAAKSLNFDKENGSEDGAAVRGEERRRASGGGVLQELDDGVIEIGSDSEGREKDVVEDVLDQSKLNQSVDTEADVSAVISSEDEQNVSATSPPSSAAKKVKSVDRLRRLDEKQRLKREKEDLKRQEKEKKLKAKEEEKKKKEDEKKRREETKEEEKKKKEDEKKRREETKEEEKKRREDEKRRKEEAKEEERRKKDEERKKKEELKEEDRKKKEEAKLAEERKESLAKLAFTKFFVQGKAKAAGRVGGGEEGEQPAVAEAVTFMPFPVKSDMRLAAVTRNSISEEQKVALSRWVSEAEVPVEELYLSELKGGRREAKGARATWPASEEQHDVIIVESTVEGVVAEGPSSAAKGARAKLIQFHENRRPPYWGTWRRRSGRVKGRRPLGKDATLDYEVDSDSEWEDEGEGEDLDKENESDKEQSDDDNVGENGYLLDKTFVPHGYLSDEEAEAEEEEEGLAPEDQKMKLKVLKQEFEQEMKRKAERLKPRLLGCVWISNETTEVSPGSLYETLMSFRCRWDEEKGPVEPVGPETAATPPTTPSTAKFPSAHLRQLATAVHGSRLSHVNLVTEFIGSLEKGEGLSTISKRAVSLKIREIATKTLKSPTGRVWEVMPALAAEFGLPNLAPPPAATEPSPAPPPPTLPAAPKPKESPLANFLRMAPVPAAPKRRVVPTLISPVVSTTPSTSPAPRRIVPTTLTTSPAPRRIVPTALPPDPNGPVARSKISTFFSKRDSAGSAAEEPPPPAPPQPAVVALIDLSEDSK